MQQMQADAKGVSQGFGSKREAKRIGGSMHTLFKCSSDWQ